ncbi:leucine-rich repeat protein [Ruminococcus flavefaciens]|uniref:Leucine rich repeat-containing protein n=1 Tax=Ruminococcus flavefaciens TaxID=1265 RepID=A0A1K1PIY1_RUMFL|nr:leucine-rich repeat protein [Ruminococcus flavefaciens]SFW47395.1 Leucine rich repeat-containing protein [Ruminococcus flavefaciens]
MKIKKIIAFFMSSIMTLSALSLSSFSSYAETDSLIEMKTETNDSGIQYEGLFGSMLSDEISESAEKKQGILNSDYAIYKLEYDENVKSVEVGYRAKNDCTLFVGFYNDEGTELITSVTKELKADSNGFAEVYAPSVLPDYFLIKVFMVDSQFLNPLTDPFVYNKCTFQMQEILNKTTENFEENDIVNLDEKNNNNFVVLQEGVNKITPTDSTDIYIGEDENGNYIFENAVDIATLQKGDKAFVTCSPDMIAFKVKEIKSDGEKTIVSHEDVQIDEFIKFLKVNSDEYTGEKHIKDTTNEEQVEHREQLPQPFSPNSDSDDPYLLKLPTIKSELSATIDDYIYNRNDFEINSNSTGDYGTVSLKEEGHIELYFEAEKGKDVFCSATADVKVEVEVSIGVSFELLSFPKFGTRYPVFLTGFVNIYFYPKFTVTAQGEGVVGYEREFHLNCDTKNGIDYSITDPVTKKMYGKVTIELAIDLSFELDVAIFTIFKISPRGGIRAEIESGSEVSKGEKITGHIDSENVNITKEEPYERHDCEACCDVKISFFIELDIVFCIEIFGVDDLGVEWIIHVPIWESAPLQFYINEEGVHKGECPNKSHRIILNVYDMGEDKGTKGKPAKNAMLSIKTDDTGYMYIEDDKGQIIKTNDEGQAEAWIKDEILKDEMTVVMAQDEKGNKGYVAVGKYFDNKLKKPNSFDIIINNVAPETPKEFYCGIDPSKSKVLIFDLSKGDKFDKENRCIVKNTSNGQIKVPLSNFYVDYFSKNELEPNSRYVYFTEEIADKYSKAKKVKYIIDENGEVRFEGNGYIKATILQELSKTKEIKKAIIGSGVKTNCMLKEDETNEEVLYGFNLNNFKFADNSIRKSPVEELCFNGDNGEFIIDKFAYNNEYIQKVELSLFKTIGKDAFYGCINLSEINMPSSLELIDDRAFANCKKLEEIELNQGLLNIGKSAFNGSSVISVYVPYTVENIGTWAFNNTPLRKIVIRNRDCILGASFVPENTVVYGYMNSTAHKYVINNSSYNLKFVPLDPETPDTVTPKPITTVKTTTAVTSTFVKTTTTTAAVVTTQVVPDSECVFIAVNDDKTVNGSTDELLDRENVRFFDQRTANGDGVVSFSYLPDENEKWAFIFVSEAINDTITKAFGTPDALKITTYNVAPGVKGDANGDGEIDMSDVVLIMQALANPNKYGIEGTDPKHITVSGFGYADSDGDGLTVNDALRIQQYLLGLIPSLT